MYITQYGYTPLMTLERVNLLASLYFYAQLMPNLTKERQVSFELQTLANAIEWI